jgi:hypothetical protein
MLGERASLEPVRQVGDVRQVLGEVPTLGHGHDLQPSADAQDGDARLARVAVDRHLELVAKVAGGVVLGVWFLPVHGGRDVRAAGEDQRIDARHELGCGVLLRRQHHRDTPGTGHGFRVPGV